MSSASSASLRSEADPAATSTDAAPASTTGISPSKRATGSRRTLIFILLLAAILAGGVTWYIKRLGVESTDDAQIDGDVVSVPARTSAVVTKVLFTDNQLVKAGDPLVELDDAPTRAHLAAAEASLESAKAAADAADADARVAEINARSNHSAAQASLSGAASSATAFQDQVREAQASVVAAQAEQDKAKLDLERARSLFAGAAIPKAQLDQAQTAYDTTSAQLSQANARLAMVKSSTSEAQSRIQEANAHLQQTSDVDVLIAQARARARTAHAQVATAQAARDLAALDLSYTRIVAPQSGTVSKRTVAVGQMVSPGQPIVQLIPTQALWVTANFKETQLENMHPGQKADIEVDAFSRRVFHGHVESFSSATGARFALLPPDNATGNYTRVVQRVPVRIAIDDLPTDVSLRPGMSVTLTVHLH